MIVVEQAILHILDLQSGKAIYSDELLELTDTIEAFLHKHIEKALKSQDACLGTFYDDSLCKQQVQEYLTGAKDFVGISKELAHVLEEALVHTEEMRSVDVIVAELRVEEVRMLAIFQCASQLGYAHQAIATEQGHRNEIALQFAILPTPAQRIEEFAFIDLEKLSVSYVGKKYKMDGSTVFLFPEVLLECRKASSPKETIKSISKTAQKVAESFGQDAVATEAAVKSYIAERAQETEMLDPVEAGREIFKDQPSMQASYEDYLQETGVTEPVRVDPETTVKRMERHKLKTDTGIELTIPTDYFDNTEFIEFHNNEDGTLSIMLKHISNITNRG